MCHQETQVFAFLPLFPVAFALVRDSQGRPPDEGSSPMRFVRDSCCRIGRFCGLALRGV